MEIRNMHIKSMKYRIDVHLLAASLHSLRCLFVDCKGAGLWETFHAHTRVNLKMHYSRQQAARSLLFMSSYYVQSSIIIFYHFLHPSLCSARPHCTNGPQ